MCDDLSRCVFLPLARSGTLPTLIKRMDGAIQCKTVWLYFQVWYWWLSVNFGGPHWLYFWQGQKDEGLEEVEGVSRVRVTCRRSPHKVERVSGLVTCSHVDIPEVSKAKKPGYQLAKAFDLFSSASLLLQHQKSRCFYLRQIIIILMMGNIDHVKFKLCCLSILHLYIFVFYYVFFYNFASWADFVISSTACPLWLQSLC